MKTPYGKEIDNRVTEAYKRVHSYHLGSRTTITKDAYRELANAICEAYGQIVSPDIHAIWFVDSLRGFSDDENN